MGPSFMSPLRGILFKIISVMVFVAMSSLVKSLEDRVPAGQVVFFRSLFAMPVIIVWLWARGALATGLKVQNPMSHFWRGVVGTSAMGLGFAGIKFLPLPEVVAIGYAAPMLVVVFAAMFLGEKVGVFRVGTVLIGLIGVMIIMYPRLTVFDHETVAKYEALGAMLILMSACFAALAQIYVRMMVQSEDTAAIVFYFSLSATIISLITVPFGWAIPSAFDLGILILIGLIGGVGQIFLTSSYRYAEASVVAPFEYASMLFAIVIGYFVFDEVPTKTVLIGAAIVIFAGVVIILRERHLGLKRTKARAGLTPS